MNEQDLRMYITSSIRVCLVKACYGPGGVATDSKKSRLQKRGNCLKHTKSAYG